MKEQSFGARLRVLREARKLSQEQLAIRSGLSVSAVSKLEQGVEGSLNPRIDTLRALGRGLELTLLEMVAELFPEESRGRKSRQP